MTNEFQMTKFKATTSVFGLWILFVLCLPAGKAGILSFEILSIRTASAEPVALTLNQAIERALEANYDINIAEERLNQLKALIGETRAAALPQINTTTGYQRNIKRPQLFFNDNAVTIGNKNVYSASTGLTQTLYAAGKVLKALKAAKSEASRAEAELNYFKDEIRSLVTKTYYQILLADCTIAVTEKTLGQLESCLASIQKRYNEGLESDYTLMRQEVEVSNLRPELSGAEYAKGVLVNALKVLLALPDNAEIALKDKLTLNAFAVPPEEELVSRALTGRQDLAASKARIESMRQKLGTERGGYLPTLAAVTNLTWQAETDDFKIGSNENYYALNAGATLSWPIFDGFKTHYRIKEAKTELKIAAEEEIKKRADIISEVKNARAAHKEAVLREASQKKALLLAEKAVKIAGLRFNEGLTSQLELNDTILARDKAERLYLEAVYDCLVAQVEIERAIGGKL